ncbi:glycosyltransferase [candidate division KSB1 bacterium]
MEEILTASGIFLTSCYMAFVIFLYSGLGRLGKPRGPGFQPENDPPQAEKTVSVVVAARNEERMIAALLDALLGQDYPSDKFDIIIVNDRSEDGTRTIIDSYRENDARITCIDISDVPDGHSPKKYALTAGIGAAQGKIICTTDADCIPPPGWISALVGYFDDETGMVAGYSPLVVKDGSAIFAKYLAIDALSLAAASAGGLGWGVGLTCAGRNLAYRKSVFEEVGGFEDVKEQISGDDDLLMHLVQSKTGWKVRYATDRNAVVPSIVQPGISRYFNQRTRHASKFRIYPFRVQAVSMMIFLFYLAIGTYPLYMLITGAFLSVYAVMLAGKALVEYPAIRRGSRLLGADSTAERQQFGTGTFLFAFFVHPLLIVLFSILGTRGRFTWKGREFGKG